MALSVFDSKDHAPGAAALQAALGRTAPLWDALVAHVSADHAPIRPVWNFAGEKFGWSLRLVQKDRVVLYLIPQRAHFLAGIVLGEKAEAAARAQGLPEPIVALLDAAPKYAEGRGVRVPVHARADLLAVRVLARAKMAPRPAVKAPAGAGPRPPARRAATHSAKGAAKRSPKST